MAIVSFSCYHIADLLQYGLPLYSFAQLAIPFVVRETPAVNFLRPSLALANSSDGLIIEPNDDTLYSAAIFDLSQKDVIITVPEVDADRYWVFPFADP